MLIWQAIILGVVQGITEWLPVSSSGHLAIIQNLFGLEGTVAFDVVLHLATLLVIFLVFWKDIWRILKAVFTLNFKDKYGKFALFIIIGSVPIALVGYFLNSFIKGLFYNLLAVGVALLFSGFLLFISEKWVGKNPVKWWQSILIGIAQAVAIVPGVSRSGATISSSLLLKINRQDAVKFSFLLAIPAIIGASVSELSQTVISNWSPVVIGSLFSVLVGYVALKWLIKIITEKKFHLFSYYCWLIGIVSIILYFVI